MKVEINSKITQEFIQDHKLKNGEIGIIVDDSYGTDPRKTMTGDPLLSTYDGFVNLRKPDSTWGNSCSIMVRKMLPRETVLMTVE